MRIVQKKGVQKLLLRKRQLKQKQAGSASSAAAFEFVSARRHVAVADHIKNGAQTHTGPQWVVMQCVTCHPLSTAKTCEAKVGAVCSYARPVKTEPASRLCLTSVTTSVVSCSHLLATAVSQRRLIAL